MILWEIFFGWTIIVRISGPVLQWTLEKRRCGYCQCNLSEKHNPFVSEDSLTIFSQYPSVTIVTFHKSDRICGFRYVFSIHPGSDNPGRIERLTDHFQTHPTLIREIMTTPDPKRAIYVYCTHE